MNVRKRLSELNRPVRVEVVYLAARYLTHGLDETSFRRQLEADSKVKYRDQSTTIVLDIISSIEAGERQAVRDLTMARRFELASDLDDLLWDEAETAEDEAKINDALAALKKAES